MGAFSMSFSRRVENFAQKRVCVVGGTSGMGAAIAMAAAKLNADVWITGSHSKSVSNAEVQFQGKCHIHQLDIRDPDAIREYCLNFTELDALINCAGVSFPNLETDPSVFSDAITVNLTGIGHICLGMKESLAARKGCIVNFGSMTSFLGSASNPAYSAAKGGIIQLTKSLARMWGAEGIRVNAIAPGYIQTKMTAFRWKSEEGTKEIVTRVPLSRWGMPEDVVGPTLFLCSEDAAYITGAVIPVDGGFLLT